MVEVIYNLLASIRLNLFIIFLILNIVNLFRRIRFDEFINKLFCYTFILVSLIELTLFFINFENSKSRFYGEYSYISWSMLAFASLSPFLLLIKKFRNKIYSFLIISFLMNIGRIFELIVILTTTFHRDYL
jgi:hypothetical protein